MPKHDPAGRRKVVHAFIEGLHWVLEYYYRGVASWTWFFPYHYGPMISDMEGIEENQVAFQQGTPFLPFQQLLGVLPSASHKLLPEPYQASAVTAKQALCTDPYPETANLNSYASEHDQTVLWCCMTPLVLFLKLQPEPYQASAVTAECALCIWSLSREC